MVTIYDPVAQTNIVLMPDGQTATKMSTVHSMVRTMVEKRTAEAMSQEMGAKVHSADGSARTVIVTSADGYTVASDGVMAKRSTAVEEDLGTQVIEGVSAEGKRSREVIPAGKIGNDRPIEIVSESWYSNELQTVVLSKRSDPRMGETEFRLTNIQRSEPARALFEIPAGYTVK